MCTGNTFASHPGGPASTPPDYEPDTVAFLRRHRKPGGTVLDVGCHFGLISVLMARMVRPGGRVISFKPTPSIRAVCERVVRFNGLGAIIEVRPEAVGATTGTTAFYDRGDPGSNANSLVPLGHPTVETTVPVVSLDGFTHARDLSVSCIKVDVEGGEFDLLRGAGRLLRRCRPAVFPSVHPAAIRRAGRSLAALWGLAQTSDLVVVRHEAALSEAVFCSAQELFDVALLPRKESRRPRPPGVVPPFGHLPFPGP